MSVLKNEVREISLEAFYCIQTRQPHDSWQPLRSAVYLMSDLLDSGACVKQNKLSLKAKLLLQYKQK